MLACHVLQAVSRSLAQALQARSRASIDNNRAQGHRLDLGQNLPVPDF
jgi:hypothetical protein